MKTANLFLLGLILIVSCTNEEPKELKQYTINQFYKNISMTGGVFSENESKLLVSSDETGIFNVYEINIADNSKKQLTHSTVESFFAIDYLPGSNKILYSADKGGNEISHIYLLNEDGNSEDLTPGEEEKTRFRGWSKDKEYMYYSSNKRDPKFYDFYKMSIEDRSTEIIYQNVENLQFSDLSDDENIIALSKSITRSENQLFLYNRTTKEMIEISETDAVGNYSSSGFSNDINYFYYITDKGKEFKYLVEYTISTGDKKPILETDWDVMYSYLSENEKYRVTAINEDGKNSLIITDNETKKEIEFPPIPDGNILSVSVSESEKNMRLTVGSSKSSSNYYIYNFDTEELKCISNNLNPEINPEDLVAAEVIRYKSFDGLEIPAIYYKPINASKNNKVPALVWVHGGPGGQSRVGYFALIQYLVNHGYALLAVNNRGSSGYGKTFYKADDRNHGDKDLKDCVSGKKWLQTLDYIDHNKIGIIGGSYGGYMTMAAMTFEPDEFKVGVNLFGVTNWLRTLKSMPPDWESFKKALYEEMGDPNTEDSVRLYNISPVFHAHQIKNPIIVLQGANDPRVLQIESDEIVEAVKKSNVPVEYIIFPDEGHGFIKKENQIEGYGKILKFLDKYLKEVVGKIETE